MKTETQTGARKGLLLAGVALVGVGAVAAPLLQAYPVRAETAPNESLVTADGSYAPIVKKAGPAIVTVSVRLKSGAEGGMQMQGQGNGAPPPGMEEFFRRFFGENAPMPGGPNGPGMMPGQPAPTRGLGSGFIVSADGTIVTNNHVVANADKITVTLDDGRELPATLVGTDPRTDIAVLKVEATGLPTVEWGDSDRVEVGDKVIAIGNPFGVGTTVTAGILSARGRDLHSGPYDDFLQVDAAINHGNSGGALVATDGKVVGITSAIFSPNDGNVGVGFAIPSDLAQKIVADLMDDGNIERGYLGVRIQPVDGAIAESLGLDGTGGALVSEVTAGTPAEKAGLKTGDVVLAVNGNDVATPRDLSLAIAEIKPGTGTELAVWRDGSRQNLDVTVASLPGDDQMAAASQAAPTVPSLGLGLQQVTPDQRGPLGLEGSESGVVVTSVDPASTAAEKGIQTGDVILSANNQPVATPGDVEAAVKKASEGGKDAILLLVSRQGENRFVAVPVRMS